MDRIAVCDSAAADQATRSSVKTAAASDLRLDREWPLIVFVPKAIRHLSMSTSSGTDHSATRIALCEYRWKRGSRHNSTERRTRWPKRQSGSRCMLTRGVRHREQIPCAGRDRMPLASSCCCCGTRHSRHPACRRADYRPHDKRRSPSTRREIGCSNGIRRRRPLSAGPSAGNR